MGVCRCHGGQVSLTATIEANSSESHRIADGLSKTMHDITAIQVPQHPLS